MKGASQAGDRLSGGAISMPSEAKRWRVSSSSSVFESASFAFFTIASDVPFGNWNADQAPSVKAGRPASAAVGRSGIIVERLSLVMAYAFRVPALTCSTVSGAWLQL